jgi:hypothetical protein
MAFSRLASLIAATAVSLLAAALPSGRAADISDSGLAMIPADAAFLSSTLRLREQYDAIVSSKAFAAVRRLPAVARFFDSLAEQKAQPGHPLSIVDTFLQLPENQEALDLLADMVATETFVYGEPSWIKLLELLSKVQRAQQAANILGMARGDASLGGLDFDFELPEPADPDDDDDAAAARRVPVRPVRFQVRDGIDVGEDNLAAALMLETLADNADLLVIPDTVWGFTLTKAAPAATQLKRLEGLLQLVTQANPDLADAVQRKTIRGGEFVTFTFKPDSSLLRLFLAEVPVAAEKLDAVINAVDKLEVVVALGIVGERVILSVGDSLEHIEKLSAPEAGRGLLATKPMAPLLDHRDKSITAVSHVSADLMKVLATSTEDIDQLADLSDDIARLADLPEGAAADIRGFFAQVSAQYREWLPVPGPWTAFSFRSEQGYEGYAWDWSQNGPFDGRKRLDLLEHVGGAPLAATVARGRTDVPRFDHVVGRIDMGWNLFKKHVLPSADEDVQEWVATFDEHLAPLGKKFVAIVRRTFVPALANGQIGFVIDGKGRTTRLHESLPAAEAPLPLLEPAIVLAVDDAGLFRDGMNDLFALGDELVDAMRELPDSSIPAEYRIPDPEKTKVEGGSVWSWPLTKAGIDEQVQPSIALGKDTVVFSLVPRQAGRLIVESPLETGSRVAAFEEPLAAAATLDVAGLIDAIEPWVVYLLRYAAEWEGGGNLASDQVLDADAGDAKTKDILEHAKVVLEAARSLRVATAETMTKPEATVTHWRNVIRDMAR